MKNTMISQIKKMFLVLLGSIVVGFLILNISFLLPVGPMRNHVGESIEMLKSEGIHPELIKGFVGTQLDNYSEGLILNSAIYDENESVIRKSSENFQYVYNGEDYYKSLIAYYENNFDKENFDIGNYARYWHGYLTIVKPLLILFNYSEIRMLNMLLQLILLFTIVYLMKKNELSEYVPCYVLALFFMTVPILFMSMEYSIILYITMFAVLVLLMHQKIIVNKGLVTVFFEMIGIFVAYNDLLTYPLLSLGMPLVFFWLLEGNIPESKMNLKKQMVIPVFSWFFGYAGMWFGKWAIASLFTEENVIKDAILMVFYRMSKTSGESGEVVTFSLQEVLKRNFGVFNNGVYLLAVGVFIVFILIRIIKNRGNLGKWRNRYFYYVLISITPLIWYMLIGNHSYIHYWMTYRNIVVMVFATACLLVQISSSNNKLQRKE